MNKIFSPSGYNLSQKAAEKKMKEWQDKLTGIAGEIIKLFIQYDLTIGDSYNVMEILNQRLRTECNNFNLLELVGKDKGHKEDKK